MGNLGEVLRTKREEMKLSLKEIENSTSIRAIYLQAIEEGRIGQFLSNAYALGFIRQYANFLGLDSEKLLKEHAEALHLPTEKQDFAYGIGTMEVRSSLHGSVRWMPNLLWGVAIVSALLGAYYFARFVGLF